MGSLGQDQVSGLVVAGKAVEGYRMGNGLSFVHDLGSSVSIRTKTP